MKLETAITKVVTYLQENGPSTKQTLSDATGIKGLDMTNALKRIKKEGILVEEGEGSEMLLSIQAQADEPQEQPEETTGEEGGEAEDTPAPKGRNTQKYKFNGEEYGKGPLVRAVVGQYVADHPKTTYKQLKEAFPDELLKRFGIFQDEDKARELSGARDRYFFKEEQMIKLKDKTIAVCNQFTAENIQPFLKAAKQLGYKIK